MLSLIKKELILQCIKEIEKTGNYPSYVNRIFQYGDDDDYDAQNIFNLELYKQFIIEKKKMILILMNYSQNMIQRISFIIFGVDVFSLLQIL